MVIDSVVLIVAVVRVYRLLKDEKDLNFNQKYMAMHIGLFLFFTLSQFTNTLSWYSKEE